MLRSLHLLVLFWNHCPHQLDLQLYLGPSRWVVFERPTATMAFHITVVEKKGTTATMDTADWGSHWRFTHLGSPIHFLHPGWVWDVAKQGNKIWHQNRPGALPPCSSGVHRIRCQPWPHPGCHCKARFFYCILEQNGKPWSHPSQHHLLLHVAGRQVHPRNLQRQNLLGQVLQLINLFTLAGSRCPVELRSAWRKFERCTKNVDICSQTVTF